MKRDQTERGRGVIAIVTAGTSDIPVAEEAAVTVEVMGNRTERLYDVGVAGIHRVLSQRELLQSARVVVCAAGMEGALPSVVGGLVGVPVIAVPTSIGYGARWKSTICEAAGGSFASGWLTLFAPRQVGFDHGALHFTVLHLAK